LGIEQEAVRFLERIFAQADRTLERQRAAPEYHERVTAVRAKLAARHVHPDIIERVIRLNPKLEEGYWLRGIHYKRHHEPGINIDAQPKGRFLKKHGREAWDAIPKDRIIKKGRREYITGLTWMQYGN